MEVGKGVKERVLFVVILGLFGEFICLFVASMWTSQGSVAGPTVEGG